MKNQKTKYVSVLGLTFFLMNSDYVHAKNTEQKTYDNSLSVRFGYGNLGNISNKNQVESGTESQNFEISYTTKKPVKNLSDDLSLSFSFTYLESEVHGINFGKNDLSADGNFIDIYNFSIALNYSWNLFENLDLNISGNIGLSFLDKREKNPVREIDLETKFLPTVGMGISLEYKVNDQLSFEVGCKGYRFLDDLVVIYHDNGKERKLESDYKMLVPFLGFSYKF